MKELRASAVAYRKAQQKAKEQAKEVSEAIAEKKKVDNEIRVTTKKAKNEPKKKVKIIDEPDEKPSPRYSTYKKSIWSQFI